MACVGYVNALVIENGILNKLPAAILTQDHIIKADRSLLEKIEGESPSQAARRGKDKGRAGGPREGAEDSAVV